jgi:hypothetical protein
VATQVGCVHRTPGGDEQDGEEIVSGTFCFCVNCEVDFMFVF